MTADEADGPSRADAAWQMVVCIDCGKRYQCTPENDYYNNTTLGDGVCETCLLTNAGIHPDKILTVDRRQR